MLTRTIRVRVDQATAEQLDNLAASWHVTLSQALRDSVALLLAHPGGYGALLAARRGYTEDRRTPEQIRNGDAYMQSLAAMDLTALLPAMEPVLQQSPRAPHGKA